MKKEDVLHYFDQTPQSWKGSGWHLLNEQVDPYGIVSVGGSLSVERLKMAYGMGIFPWPQDDQLLWFCPPKRGVLDFNELKIPSRLARKYKNTMVGNGGQYHYTLNQAFSQVIKQCALQKRKNQTGTWITSEMIQAYVHFFKAGHVLSFECWNKEALVGGLYGVITEKCFSGESVFGLESDVAKFCLLKAIEHLKSQGQTWMDIQMVTPLTAGFGGKLISRVEFLARMMKVLSQKSERKR